MGYEPVLHEDLREVDGGNQLDVLMTEAAADATGQLVGEEQVDVLDISARTRGVGLEQDALGHAHRLEDRASATYGEPDDHVGEDQRPGDGQEPCELAFDVRSGHCRNEQHRRSDGNPNRSTVVDGHPEQQGDPEHDQAAARSDCPQLEPFGDEHGEPRCPQNGIRVDRHVEHFAGVGEARQDHV